MPQHEGVSRRTFLAKSSAGVGGGVAGIYAAHRSAPDTVAAEGSAGGDRLPREVWVASMGQMNLQSGAKTPLDVGRAMIARMEEAMPTRPDIFCTPEVFPVVGLPGGVRPPLSAVAEERYENWTKLSRKGAKIVFWPSAFGGGMMLNSLAWMNKYYLVTSTRGEHPTKIVDPRGQDVVCTGRVGNWVCAPINLDIAVVQSAPLLKKFRDIQEKYGRRFHFRILHIEALGTIEGNSGDISVADVLKEFAIPTSVEKIEISTMAQDARRPL